MKFNSRCVYLLRAPRSFSCLHLPLSRRQIVPGHQGQLIANQIENFYTLQDSSFSKCFHGSSNVYKVFGSYNPLKVLDTWYDLGKLKREWDPNFSLIEFKLGATQALHTVISLVQKNLWDDLRGLLTRPIIERLQQDKETLKKINDTQDLSSDKIKVDVTRVSIQEIVDRKYCDIDATFLIANNLPDTGSQVMFQYTFRFHREYTDGKVPEWTIIKISIEDKRKKD